MWAYRSPAKALAPVSPVCRLIKSLWDLVERDWDWDWEERRGHGQAKDKLGLGHLKFMRKHLFDLTV